MSIAFGDHISVIYTGYLAEHADTIYFHSRNLLMSYLSQTLPELLRRNTRKYSRKSKLLFTAN